jgi:exodeoxyribonuclease VII small subunit
MAKRKKASPKSSDSVPGLEEALERLEAIARRLEEEEQLSLDESLRLFEEGVALSRQCGKRLEEAEQKVEVLMRQADGSLETEELEAEGSEE